MNWTTQKGSLELGEFVLQSGAVIKNAQLSWKSYGTLSPAADNVILYPTSFAAQHPDTEWLIGPHSVLDPTRWFIVIPDMFGNGLSSSPSNTSDYPALVSAFDNVHAQRRLLDQWGIDRLACIYGWSMGAQQAYHWAAVFPEAVERIVVNCGSARTSPHNQVFLKGLMAILDAAPESIGAGRYSATPLAALRAFGRVYAGWAMSQTFFREGTHLNAFDAPDLDSFLGKTWDIRFIERNAANLYAHLSTWVAADISANSLYEGDLVRALKAIKSKVLLMPGQTDLYFRVEDNENELKHLAHAQLLPIPSQWGHQAGNPISNEQDMAFVRSAVRNWLAA